MPSPDASEEERWAAADARGALCRAQAERGEVAARLDERKGAVGRAEQHLASETAELRGQEERLREREHKAAASLAERLRKGATTERTIEIEVPADLDLARHKVEVAQQALDALTIEAEHARDELRRAEQAVGGAVADVVRQELLKIARAVDEDDREAARPTPTRWPNSVRGTRFRRVG